MAGVKQGVDSRGRRYMTVDGKRVPIGGNKPAKPTGRASTEPVSINDPIKTFVSRWMRGASTPEQVKKSVGDLIASKFRLWFLVAGKTAVGKAGRLYAARQLLEHLGDKEEPPTTKDGQLDPKKFLEKLKGLGVDVDPSDAGGEGPTEKQPTGEDSDQAILQVVRSYGLNAEELEEVLRQHSA